MAVVGKHCLNHRRVFYPYMALFPSGPSSELRVLMLDQTHEHLALFLPFPGHVIVTPKSP